MATENNVGAEPGTLGAVVLCRCGCECEASWLCTGYEYDPYTPDHRGQPFRDEPCCEGSKAYLEDASAEFGHSFSARRIHAQNARLQRPGAAGENDGN
jgi:hypothetical protein